ncbi:MAG TPA: 2'-5' RNA ligase family protein, partial [Candidatus Nitrosotenuis sp.]|nr:2'-5' RNA ligase family protein [Candidatus Nitrosotenuis sp.]
MALDPGPGVQGKMAEIQARLARSGAARHVRWVAPENLHLTLKFLGETPEDKIPQIEEVLRRVASQHSSLELELAGVG